ncbi:MAG: tRNA (adenosine(37)-N6)-dimethylallyltransferase MiaA [Pedobacter sp.]|nr:MAG: tRNA (adenosine(37)-N6)-dimethylallyltransferase MiaA [Pedobacter sp.]
MHQNPLLIILGATASGKTRLAIEIAKTLNGEIISADSRQVFRGMDIGTGKDLEDFHVANVPFHLIDIKEAGERYHVNSFKEDFYKAFQTINFKQKLPILCGGTGMYIHSILQNYELTAVPVNDELRNGLLGLGKLELVDKLNTYSTDLHSHVDFSSSKRLIRAIEVAEYLSSNLLVAKERPLIDSLVVGLVDDLDTRKSKIDERLIKRLDNGLIKEVEQLIANGVSADMLTFYGLEYKFVVSYLKGEIDYSTLKERLAIAIHQFAKRQMTFFRKMEKDGVKINWLKASVPLPELTDDVLRLISRQFELSGLQQK